MCPLLLQDPTGDDWLSGGCQMLQVWRRDPHRDDAMTPPGDVPSAEDWEREAVCRCIECRIARTTMRDTALRAAVAKEALELAKYCPGHHDCPGACNCGQKHFCTEGCVEDRKIGRRMRRHFGLDGSGEGEGDV